jgi:hypothetical protein
MIKDKTSSVKTEVRWSIIVLNVGTIFLGFFLHT